MTTSARSFEVTTEFRNYDDSSVSQRMAEIGFCKEHHVVGVYAHMDGPEHARACPSSSNRTCVGMFWSTSSYYQFIFPCYIVGNVENLDERIEVVRQCVHDALDRIGMDEYKEGNVLVETPSSFYFQMKSTMEIRFIMHSKQRADPVMCYMTYEVTLVSVGVGLFVMGIITCMVMCFCCWCGVDHIEFGPCCDRQFVDSKFVRRNISSSVIPTTTVAVIFLAFLVGTRAERRPYARIQRAEDASPLSSTELLSGSKCKDVELLGFKYDYQPPYRCVSERQLSSEACFNVMWLSHELKPETTWEGQYACSLGISWSDFELSNSTIYLADVRACLLDALRASWSSKAVDMNLLNENCNSEVECAEKALEGMFFPDSNLYLLKSSFPMFLWFEGSTQWAEPQVCWTEYKRHWVGVAIAIACLAFCFGTPHLCNCYDAARQERRRAERARSEIEANERRSATLMDRIEKEKEQIEIQVRLQRLILDGASAADLDADFRLLGSLRRGSSPILRMPVKIAIAITFLGLFDIAAAADSFARSKVFAGPISFDQNMIGVGPCYDTHVSEVRCEKTGNVNETTCRFKPCSPDGKSVQSCFSLYWIALEANSFEEREIEFLCFTDRPFDHSEAQPDHFLIRRCISSALFSVGRGADDRGEFFDDWKTFRFVDENGVRPYVPLRFVKFSSTWIEPHNCMFKSERDLFIILFTVVGIVGICVLVCVIGCVVDVYQNAESNDKTLYDSLEESIRAGNLLDEKLRRLRDEIEFRNNELKRIRLIRVD